MDWMATLGDTLGDTLRDTLRVDRALVGVEARFALIDSWRAPMAEDWKRRSDWKS